VKHSLTCVAFRRVEKNTLVGFASIKIEQIRLTIHDIALHRKGSSRWAQLPARPFVRDGIHLTDDLGKAKYLVTLEFENRKVSEAFSHATWAAVLAAHPGLDQEIAA
jgi:hypothetical protein